MIKEVVAIDGARREVVYKDGTRKTFEQHKEDEGVKETPQKPVEVMEPKPVQSPAKNVVEGKRKRMF